MCQVPLAVTCLQPSGLDAEVEEAWVSLLVPVMSLGEADHGRVAPGTKLLVMPTVADSQVACAAILRSCSANWRHAITRCQSIKL